MEKHNIEKKSGEKPHKFTGTDIVTKCKVFDGTGRNASFETKVMQIYMPSDLIFKILGEECAQYKWCWFIKV